MYTKHARAHPPTHPPMHTWSHTTNPRLELIAPTTIPNLSLSFSLPFAQTYLFCGPGEGAFSGFYNRRTKWISWKKLCHSTRMNIPPADSYGVWGGGGYPPHLFLGFDAVEVRQDEAGPVPIPGRPA